MRAYVLSDARLAKHAGRFVRLDVDAERTESAAFLARFPVESYPTLFVIDPAQERAVVKWAGAAGVEEVVMLLSDGRRAMAGAHGADALLADGDRAHAERRFDDAAKAYRAALDRGGPSWPRRARAADSLVSLLAARDDPRCAREARALVGSLPPGPARADVAAAGLGCALASDASSPGAADVARALERSARAALRDPGVVADVRSGLYETLVEARKAGKDDPGARATAQAWWAFLAHELERAPDARARSAFSAAVVSAAEALGEPARALRVVARSERELPGDYDPPYWVAVASRDAGRLDDALTAADRALALAYGARKLRIYSLRASILEAKGDRAALRATLDEAVRFARELPPQQLRRKEQRILEKLQAKRQELGEG
jgi:tetratricopeptide (TPR) repeat protein